MANQALLRHLGGVDVIVLATGPKGSRVKPGQGDGFLTAIKMLGTPSFAGEVKRRHFVIRFYGMLKNLA
jgi:hypothetical protein